MMDVLLKGIRNYAEAYLDDLVIFSQTWEEHCEHLRAVLRRLREAGLTARPSKCQIAMRQCTYLGHQVGNGEVRPERQKIEAVAQFARPVTKKDVHSFLGLTGYYWKFVPDYAAIAVPLINCTKKDTPKEVNWTTACEAASVELKRRLTNAPVLKSPDLSRLFIL